MPIGDLARKAAVNIQTIRFYEREGLLPVPSRNSSGYRRYESGDRQCQRDDLVPDRARAICKPNRQADKHIAQDALSVTDGRRCSNR